MTLKNCGLIEDEEIGVFSNDWYANTTDEIYMRRILRHAYKSAEACCYQRFDGAKMGDVVLCKSAGSRLYNHGGIVIQWPLVVHAIAPAVEMIDASRHTLWAYQQISAYDPWPKYLERVA